VRTVPAAMTDAWHAVMKGGDARPVMRAVVLKTSMKKFEYDTAKAPGDNFTNQRSRTGHFATIIFGDTGPMRELRNIKSFTWSRSVFQDVATATLVLTNTDHTPVGSEAKLDPNGGFDQPGKFTYSRGSTETSRTRWGYELDNAWRDILVPDRLVRTYEGYGVNPNTTAPLDENLMISGTWLIDKVRLSATNGDITLEMRDVGRLLLDQIVFPPVVPYAEYPLQWDKIRTENVPGRDVTGGSWQFPKGTASSSNDLYIGAGLTNPPLAEYVSSNGGVNGHHASHVLKDDPELYWVSTGQENRSDKVYWEIDLDDTTTAMNGVRLQPFGGPYRVYVSLRNAKGWIGKKKIPYEVGVGGIDLKAGIPFVKSAWADRNRTFDIILPRKYSSIRKIRITITRLSDARVGIYPWFGGLRDLRIYTAADVSSLGFAKGEVLKTTGNYSDYSHIVKWCCAWGGFFWPPPESGLSFVHVAQGNNYPVHYATPDNILPKGRAWGHFQRTGTAGEVTLKPDLFDKRPLMDVVNYVRDIVGFNFFIDEAGAVVWRMPNLWTLGNYLSKGPLEGDTRIAGRTSSIITLDELETLYDYDTSLDSADIRERIFVANSTGKFGTVIKGYIPHKVGFRRIAGWTDQRFEKKSEVRVVADLLAAQSKFNYKRSQVVIPGYPAIQIDDQVRIFERVTDETYHHYISGITSNFDAESGDWTYTLETHWLGEDPSTEWVVTSTELHAATQNYLSLIGEGD
jgi:hypothetical protein